MNDLEKCSAAKDALEFLQNHPALNGEMGDSICDGFWFIMQRCCKHGKSEDCGKYGIRVYHEDGYEKYKDLFDEEYKNIDEKDEPIKYRCVEVPYEHMYGEPWKYDHMEYWYELTFFVFEGDPYLLDDNFKHEKYGRYAGPMDGGDCFEDMLIHAALEAKKVFGDYNLWNDSLLTPAEIACHNAVEPMNFIETENKNLKQMVFNKGYVDVNQGLLNLRWLEKFMATDYAKENWSTEFERWKLLVSKIKDLEPQSRKDILAKYKV